MNWLALGSLPSFFARRDLFINFFNSFSLSVRAKTYFYRNPRLVIVIRIQFTHFIFDFNKRLTCETIKKYYAEMETLDVLTI